MAKKKARSGGYRQSGGGSGRTLWIAGGAGALAAIVVVAGVLAFAGGGDDGPERSSGMDPPVVITGTSAAVEIVDNRFKPQDIIISPGTTVTWTNNGSLPHDVTEQKAEDQRTFASDTMSKGDTFVRKFETAGDYYYYCTIHHSMIGSVQVRP